MLSHMRHGEPGSSGGSAPPVKRPLLRKIYALFDYRQVKYAAAILRNQGGPDAQEWVTPTQLYKVVEALEYDRCAGRSRERLFGAWWTWTF